MHWSEGSPGSDLLTLCSGAERELVLIAPFIKVRSLKRLLVDVSQDVTVTCVTRWRPEEVVVGVSDLEVFDVMKGRDRAELLLLPRLHGKYFRSDENCLVGSANLTDRALGWAEPANIELWLKEPFSRRDLRHFEEFVIELACKATEEIKMLVEAATSQIQNHLDQIPQLVALGEPIELDQNNDLNEPSAMAKGIEALTWLPSLRQPQDLFLAYQGSVDQLATSSRLAATSDLAMIDPVEGLPQPCFEAAVGIALLQMPMIVEIDQLLIKSQRFGSLRDLIAEKTGAPKNEASFMWQTTMRWLMYFLPSRYVRRVPSHSEIVVRRERSDLHPP